MRVKDFWVKLAVLFPKKTNIESPLLGPFIGLSDISWLYIRIILFIFNPKYPRDQSHFFKFIKS